MLAKVTEFVGKNKFPVIFGTGVIAACVAFANRRYFLRFIADEVKELNKQDEEFKAVYEKTRQELNR